MNYWLEIKAMSATEECNIHIKIQWGNGRKKLEVVCQWVGERYIGEKNWCYGALSNRLKLTKLLDFGLWDISPMSLAKCNEDVAETTPSWKCSLGGHNQEVLMDFLWQFKTVLVGGRSFKLRSDLYLDSWSSRLAYTLMNVNERILKLIIITWP